MNNFFNFFFLFLFFLFPQKNILSEEIYGKVRIIDGDTIEINNEKIRFSGIDAFEKKQKCNRKDGTEYACGEIAISILSMIISDQSVRCIKEKKDRYKRWLSICYIGKLDINENMVSLGYAFNYMSKKYKSAENDAMKVSAGAWSGKFIYPWKWRKLEKNDK